MARSFVFPGGGVDAAEDHLQAAARELFEEAGVLLVKQALDDAIRASLRQRLLDGADFAELLIEAKLTLALDTLQPFSHWITPSAEPKRFSAKFYVGVLPAGQTPSFDNVETVDEAWVTPAEALARIGGQATEELRDATLSQDSLTRRSSITAFLPESNVNDLTALYEYIAEYGEEDPALTEKILDRARRLVSVLEAHQDSEAASPDLDD